MNFADIKQEVKRVTGRNDTEFDDRIEEAINRAIRDYARAQPWADLKRVVELTHQGGREMAFPSNVMRVGWILDKTNVREVETVQRQWDRVETAAYSQDLTGFADFWQPAAARPVFTNVTGPLELYSSGASDVVSLYVAGLVVDTGGTSALDHYDAGETVNLVGTTPATTTNSYYRPDSICANDDHDGVIRVKSQGTVVGRIGPFERYSSYPWVRFMDIPSSGVVFRCGVYTRPAQLVNAYQAPPAAVDPDYLVWASAGDIFWQTKEGDRSVGAFRKARDIAKERKGVEMLFGDFDAQIVPQERD